METDWQIVTRVPVVKCSEFRAPSVLRLEESGVFLKTTSKDLCVVPTELGQIILYK